MSTAISPAEHMVCWISAKCVNDVCFSLSTQMLCLAIQSEIHAIFAHCVKCSILACVSLMQAFPTMSYIPLPVHSYQVIILLIHSKLITVGLLLTLLSGKHSVSGSAKCYTDV